MSSKSDKIFKRRKALDINTLKRRKQYREKRRRILIVTEGEVTEPVYLEEFRQNLALTNIDVDIHGDSDSAPVKIVQYAEKKAKAEGAWEDGGYDQIYCVFDRDSHSSFEAAKSLVRKLNKSKKFPAKRIDYICSYPCFEFWLLLHFINTRSPFVRAGKKSPCDMVVKKLKEVSGYGDIEKSLSKDLLQNLFDRIPTAITNAKKIEADVIATGEPNPSTSMYIVIEDMQKLKDEIN